LPLTHEDRGAVKLLCLLSSALCLVLSFPTLLRLQYRAYDNDQVLQFFKVGNREICSYAMPSQFQCMKQFHHVQ
jgi:hypothetical protein